MIFYWLPPALEFIINFENLEVFYKNLISPKLQNLYMAHYSSDLNNMGMNFRNYDILPRISLDYTPSS